MARPLSEIIPGLWMGGASTAMVGGQFDHVLTLCAADEERVAVPTGTAAAVWRIADAGMPDAGTVREWAQRISGWLDDGSTVLVRCAAGINRSGLVVARVLIEQGMTPAEAITMVRRRRSVDALNNQWFVQWLLSEAGEDAGEHRVLPASWRIRSRRWALPWTSDRAPTGGGERVSAVLATICAVGFAAGRGAGAPTGGLVGLGLLVVPLAAWRRRARHEATVTMVVAGLAAQLAPGGRDAKVSWLAFLGAVVGYRRLRHRVLSAAQPAAAAPSVRGTRNEV